MAVHRGSDVLGLLSGQAPLGVVGEGEPSLPPLLPGGEATERRVLAALEVAGCTAETVATQTGLEPGRVLAMLMAMVLDGRVAQRPGGRYFRTDSPATAPR